VSIVPDTCTTKVMKHARMVVRHFLLMEKLKGFAGSVGDLQSTSCFSDFGSGGDCCASGDADVLGGGFSSVSCEARLPEDRGLGFDTVIAMCADLARLSCSV
jgi:hypothetical protein